MRRLGFTVLEVLIALSILTLSLTAIYQTYGTALFSLTTTDTLWRVMSHIQNRLLFHERSKVPPPVSVFQGEFQSDHELAGYQWLQLVEDVEPLPGVITRRVRYRLTWEKSGRERSFPARTPGSKKFRATGT